jgi:hypothetical protein
MTLQEIFDYVNDHLVENELADISDILPFLNEAQNVIARIDKIPATPVSYTLTTNEVTLPSDFLRFAKATLDDVPYALPADGLWGNTLTLPTGQTSGTLKVWYWKRPEELSASTPTQVPEVDTCYHMAMANYVAKMYYLVDDDPDMRSAFEREFAGQIAAMKTPPMPSYLFVNY